MQCSNVCIIFHNLQGLLAASYRPKTRTFKMHDKDTEIVARVLWITSASIEQEIGGRSGHFIRSHQGDVPRLMAIFECCGSTIRNKSRKSRDYRSDSCFPLPRKASASSSDESPIPSQPDPRSNVIGLHRRLLLAKGSDVEAMLALPATNEGSNVASSFNEPIGSSSETSDGVTSDSLAEEWQFESESDSSVEPEADSPAFLDLTMHTSITAYEDGPFKHFRKRTAQDFRSPLGQDGEPLSMPITEQDKDDVPSGSKLDEGFTRHWPQTKTTTTESVLETLEVSVASINVDSDRSIGQGLRLFCRKGPAKSLSEIDDKIDFRWLHIDRACMDWNEFKQYVLLAPEIDNKTRITATRLLEHVETERTSRHMYGKFVTPGTTLRSELAYAGKTIEGRSQYPAAFVSFPYFNIEIQKLRKAHQNANSCSLYPTMTLLQSVYPRESTRERDSEQVLSKHGDCDLEGIVHVPQIWALALGETTLITCGPVPLAELLGDQITRVETDEPALHQKQTIRYTDDRNRAFLFQVDENPTLFELENSILNLLEVISGSEGGGNAAMVCLFEGMDEVAIRGFAHLLAGPKRIPLELTTWWEHVGSTKTTKFDPTRSTFTRISETRNITRRGTGHGETDGSNPAGETIELDISRVPPFFVWNIKDRGPFSTTGKTVARNMLRVSRYLHRPLIPTISAPSPIIDSSTRDVASRSFAHIYSNSCLKRTQDADYCPASSTTLSAQVEVKVQEVLPKPHNLLLRYKNVQDTIFKHMQRKLRQRPRDFVHKLKQLLDLFVPQGYSDWMIEDLWVSISAIITIIDGLEEGFRSASWTDPTQDIDDMKWMAHDMLEHEGLDKILHLQQPTREMSRCTMCRDYRRYQSIGDVLKHVSRSHFRKYSYRGLQSNSGEYLKSHPESEIIYWVVDTSNMAWILKYRKISDALCLGFRTVEHALGKATHIAYGVVQSDGQRSTHFQLPGSSHLAFSRILAFGTDVAGAIHHVDFTLKNEPYGDETDMWLLRWNARFSTLTRAAEGVHKTMRKFLEDVRNVPKLGSNSNPLESLMVGPQFLLAWILGQLVIRPVHKDLRTTELYGDVFSALGYQAHHHPCKRILRDIHLLQEEITALDTVNQWQINAMRNYRMVLHDKSFRNPFERRQSVFLYEQRLINEIVSKLDANHKEFNHLLKSCEQLTYRAKHSIDVNEEHHGKAILAFTAVTVIFLPLSFVTSFLGMNTLDIRNMDRTQSLFWASAIPLTITVIGGIVAIAYYGDEWRSIVSKTIQRVMSADPDLDMGRISMVDRGGNGPSTQIGNIEFGRPLRSFTLGTAVRTQNHQTRRPAGIMERARGWRAS
ncbi:hypothetical protein BU16DRAFT_232275 [Lophium mytilinum]|uniref:Cora-domain-containing protein n=1 Tax=Lophium mytilinum TaxID=390894 RepID=A0A6A6R928_9PEZI|nr:hypothetical protein BU16DRAFT_232275 [Lophium mytilinum]